MREIYIYIHISFSQVSSEQIPRACFFCCCRMAPVVRMVNSRIEKAQARSDMPRTRDS